MKYRKLNEVLIEWNESSEEDSNKLISVNPDSLITIQQILSKFKKEYDFITNKIISGIPEPYNKVFILYPELAMWRSDKSKQEIENTFLNYSEKWEQYAVTYDYEPIDLFTDCQNCPAEVINKCFTDLTKRYNPKNIEIHLISEYEEWYLDNEYDLDRLKNWLSRADIANMFLNVESNFKHVYSDKLVSASKTQFFPHSFALCVYGDSSHLIKKSLNWFWPEPDSGKIWKYKSDFIEALKNLMSVYDMYADYIIKLYQKTN